MDKENKQNRPKYIFVGDREFRSGQKIRIEGIVDKGEKIADRDLNGKIGHLTQRFDRIPFGVIGAYVKDVTDRGTVMLEVNLNLNEFQIIGGE